MEKPITVKVRDFKNDTVALINNSELPLFVIEPILRDVLTLVQTKSEQQYLQDKAVYEESLKEEAKEQSDE